MSWKNRKIIIIIIIAIPDIIISLSPPSFFVTRKRFSESPPATSGDISRSRWKNKIIWTRPESFFLLLLLSLYYSQQPVFFSVSLLLHSAHSLTVFLAFTREKNETSVALKFFSVLKVWYSCALRLERLRMFFVFIFLKNKWYYLRTTNALLITGDKWQGAAAKLRLLCFFFFFGLAEQENRLSFCTCLECVINIFADLQLA